MAGEQVGEIELSQAVFGVEPNEAALHEAVKNYLANQFTTNLIVYFYDRLKIPINFIFNCPFRIFLITWCFPR